ncbi:hypothetical protein PAXRUDRAFT_152189 [Paxillus rubicundulus Ve08.2h10]|uniref:Uncharacterized protein n=1 Tax=Paxillus rubicundulus Ve08.2h10 TaxID=930991 RepID=A0A0D0DV30_9AGAM|nr:hypothetical protein PAXRUDRAFT_152189 [Paxillus rubicundulus Ve08.2h10]
MVVHLELCAKCMGSTVPCHGLPGHTCQKCAGLKVKCPLIRQCASSDQRAAAPHIVHTAMPMAGPSVQHQLSAASGNEEGEVIVVWAGKGKAASGQVKGVMAKEVEIKEIMQWLLVYESKVQDTQVWNVELKGEVLGLKGDINCLCQK